MAAPSAEHTALRILDVLRGGTGQQVRGLASIEQTLLDILQELQRSAAPQPTGIEPPAMIRYVSPDGSDQYDGLSPRFAKRNLATAYEAVPTVFATQQGVPFNRGAQSAIAHLSPGRHDVQDGLDIWAQKEIEIVGPGRPYRYGGSGFNNMATLYSSTGAPELIRIGHHPLDLSNAQGNVIHHVSFELSGEQQYAIDAHNASYLRIDDCGFRHADPASAPTAQALHLRNTGIPGGDISWLELTGNTVVGMGLASIEQTDAGRNNNASYIGRNIVFGSSARDDAGPAIFITGGEGLTLAHNNFEVFTTAVRIGDGFFEAIAFTLHDNKGEDIGVFYELTRAYSCSIMSNPGDRHDPHTRDAILARINSGAFSRIDAMVNTTQAQQYDAVGSIIDTPGNARVTSAGHERALLPLADPQVNREQWNDAGIVTVSSG